MNPDLLFEKNGFALSSVTCGNSMRPIIWGGQHCVAFAPVDGEPVVGDILVFRPSNAANQKTYVVHRLVAVEGVGDGRRYITRGDNCLATETVRRDEIVGRVAEVHRLSGYRPWHAVRARQFTVTDRAYIRYVRFWTAIWPARRLYYLMRGHVRGLRSRVLKLIKSK